MAKYSAIGIEHVRSTPPSPNAASVRLATAQLLRESMNNASAASAVLATFSNTAGLSFTSDPF